MATSEGEDWTWRIIWHEDNHIWRLHCTTTGMVIVVCRIGLLKIEFLCCLFARVSFSSINSFYGVFWMMMNYFAGSSSVKSQLVSLYHEKIISPNAVYFTKVENDFLLSASKVSLLNITSIILTKHNS